MRIRLPRASALSGFWLLLFASFAQPGEAAGALAKPSGPVILIVTGAISQTNAPAWAEFDETMLEALGLERVTTSSRWVDGRPTFEGVLVRRLLEAVGAHGTTITATAIDDYKVDISVADITRYSVLLALRMNGQALTRRNKGPIWIVYPRDDDPKLLDSTVDANWVWQLRSIDVK